MSVSFRDAYTTHGVDNYYMLVANSYRNPHEPGVQKCLRQILESIVPVDFTSPSYRIFDLAAGSGEATLAARTWFSHRRPSIAPKLLISACDPFTHELYTTRTGLPCGKQSFRDIQIDGLEVAEGRSNNKYDVIICSFALHLCPASEVFGLLYTLSCVAKWLVVLAPHKRPEVGTEMGWERMGKEVMIERTRGRLFRSLNFGDEGKIEEMHKQVKEVVEEKQEKQEKQGEALEGVKIERTDRIPGGT